VRGAAFPNHAVSLTQHLRPYILIFYISFANTPIAPLLPNPIACRVRTMEDDDDDGIRVGSNASRISTIRVGSYVVLKGLVNASHLNDRC